MYRYFTILIHKNVYIYIYIQIYKLVCHKVKRQLLNSLNILHAHISFPRCDAYDSRNNQNLLLFLGWFLAIVANFGVAGGVHRLWSHRAFKAKVPLKIIFIICYLTSGQVKITNFQRL